MAYLRNVCIALVAALTLVGASPVPSNGTNVAIETTAGTIVVRLDTVAAPITTKNFLHLVDTGAYNGSNFYRTVSRQREPDSAIEVIQGGLQPKAIVHPIPVERTETTGLHNTNGVISMARTNDPVSATSEFFICIGDNTFLDSQKFSDHQGYAAFGNVVSGMEVVLRINHAPAEGQALTPPIKIIRIRRVR